ncbi:type VII secretion protein EccE [Plantactinospora soyae]|uniref:Type VII secretion protein EccE n=1 Tax=Plantactinospora soyae TaxID=1544732 RepID=A0A927M294_9ACTN|nr:type VII secretion protein EccE [Plantactinospora soyae]MBE1485517.1 type VII secretion protein EccE [Plantactinospora soyae]
MTVTAVPIRPGTDATRRLTRTSRLGARVGWLLPVGVGRVAIWQLAALAVLATGFRLDLPTGAVLLLATLLLAATSVRIGGQCAYQWAVIFVRYRRRRRGTSDQPAPTAVHSLAPRLLVQTQTDRSGNRAGVAAVGDDTGYTVVVQIAPTAQPDSARLVSVLHQAFDRADNPVSGARLVGWAAPVGPAPVRVYWLALRYRYADAPWPALARGGGAAGGRRAAASAAQRLRSDLADAGYPSTVLDTPELYHALFVAIGADRGAVSGSRYHAVESWRDWSVGEVRQACFTPRSAADQVPLIGLCAPGASFTCTAYALRRTAQGRVTATTTVRIGLPNSAPYTPGQVAAKLGVRLIATDGRHRENVLATLPLA